MPVKGQMNKTRTAKSKGKGLNLKWWYVLPVIAIVAVAGYLVIRYSQAGVRTATLAGGFFEKRLGGLSTKVLRDGKPVVGVVGCTVDQCQINRSSRINGKSVCAKTYVSNARGLPLSGRMTVQPYLFNFGVLDNYAKYRDQTARQIKFKNLIQPEVEFDSKTIKSSPLISKSFSGKDRWITTCARIPSTTASKYRDKQPVFAVVRVYTNTPRPDSNAINYPMGVEKIWLQN